MLRYVLAAQALRLFSMNDLTVRLYRAIGNSVGGRKRARGMPAHYLARADLNLRNIEAAHAVFDGAKVMEIGTGWVHWEALYMRCFYQVDAVVMDVWDNRQLDGMKKYAADLRDNLHSIARSDEQKSRARHLLTQVLQCESYEQIYALLNFRYVVGLNAYGSVADESLDLIFSSDVLEHVSREEAPVALQEQFRILKPGGLSAHQVVLTDHLGIYDRTIHPKNYLRYGDRTWSMLFSNGVQYINRLQITDWIAMFESAGFETSVVVTDRCDTSRLRVAGEFAHIPKQDLDVSVFTMLATKPL